MIEIKNKTKMPVQVIVRSRNDINAFTVKNIPGVGAGKNTYLIENEYVIDEYINRLKSSNMISVKEINSTEK